MKNKEIDMYRLRGSDSALIYGESPTSPYVTLKTIIYEPTTPGSAPDYAEIKAFIRQKLGGWCEQGLSMRVMRVPLDMHHPIWVRDPDFQLDNHIHRAALPKPGGRKELCNFISRILSNPLDPTRPLWDSWVLEGLEGGRIAWVMKVHHALADGKLSAKHITDIHDSSRMQVVVDSSPGYPDIPNKRSLVWRALVDLMKNYAIELPRFYYHEFQEQKRAKQLMPSVPKPTTGPFKAPHTFLNDAGGRHRVFRYETFPLHEIKHLSKLLGCTINTLFLGICSEALRRYFIEVSVLPNIPLVCVVPVALHVEEGATVLLNTEIHNNRFSTVFVPLDIRIASFEERLDSIGTETAIAIKHLSSVASSNSGHIYDYVPPSVFRLQNFIVRQYQKRKKKAVANMCISNVPGPRETLYACDGKLTVVELISCGNIADPTNLGITAWSYGDTMCVSCLFRKNSAPQPERFTQHMVDTFNELRRNYLPGDDSKVRFMEIKTLKAKQQA